MNLKKNISMMNYSQDDLINIKAISKSMGIPLPISFFLYNRNLKKETDIYSYFFNDYKLENPYKISGMLNTVKRIKRALIKDEKIVIVGDYDVDGMLSSIMLYKYLLEINGNVDIYIPNRQVDGYGLTKKLVKKLAEEYETDLIITVDMGTNSVDAETLISDYNIELIVVDHHELENNFVKTKYLVNPKIDKKNYLQDLSGGGVVFYLIRALNSQVFEKGHRLSIVNYLVLAMITTISDVMPLTNDNRKIVSNGLKFLYETNIVGLNLLLDKISFFKYPSAKDLSFKLIPIINSVGRINNPTLIIDLLTDNSLNTIKIVSDIMKINNQRKELTESLLIEASEQAKKQKTDIIIITDLDIPAGIVGLVANRISSDYKKPVFVISNDGDILKGSGRIFNNQNIKKIIDNSQYLIESGGHLSAVGFSLHRNNLKNFKKELSNYAFVNKKNIDSVEYELSLKDIDSKFISALYYMEPFGKRNEQPEVSFIVSDFVEIKVMQKKHFKIKVNDKMEILCFNASDEQFLKYNLLKKNNEIKITGTISSDGKQITLIIKNID